MYLQTVQELIRKLEKLPPDARLFVSHHNRPEVVVGVELDAAGYAIVKFKQIASAIPKEAAACVSQPSI